LQVRVLTEAVSDVRHLLFGACIGAECGEVAEGNDCVEGLALSVECF